MDLTEKYTLYILNCRCNKYYVGRTKNLVPRLEKHIKGEACSFTTVYPVLVDNPIYQIIEGISGFDEDKYVKIMMSKYGIDNVRGGSYSSLTLSPEERRFIERELQTAEDKCFNCSLSGHYAKNCPKIEKSSPVSANFTFNREELEDRFLLKSERSDFLKKEALKQSLEKREKSIISVPVLSTETKVFEKRTCERCGRTSHEVKDCYATFHYLTHEELTLKCDNCGLNGHLKWNCGSN